VGFIYTRFAADGAGAPDYLITNDLDDYNDKYNRSMDFIYDGGTSDGFMSWKARYFDGRDFDKWADPVGSNPTFFDDGIPSERNTDQQGAQGQMSFNWEQVTLTAGFDYIDYDIEATWSPQNTTYENLAGFALAKGRLMDDRLILTGGVRYDDYEVEVVEPRGNSESDTNFLPNFGVAYMVKDFLKVRANYGEAFVMPGADELAADFVFFGRRNLGNPDLDPEKSRTIEWGLDLGYGGWDVSFTNFYTNFKNKIEQVPVNATTVTWENVGKADIYGIDGEFSFDFGRQFGWSFRLQPYLYYVYLFKF
jgi:vitamin B12 transporter